MKQFEAIVAKGIKLSNVGTIGKYVENGFT